MKTKVIGASLIMAFLVSGCENPKQAIGALGGGAAGGYIGSTIGGGRGRVVATAVGAVAGALAGGYLGQQLDKADRERADRAYQNAFESSPVGRPSQWRNPDSGNYGSVTPVRTYQAPTGREFTQTISIGGRLQEGHGTACREADGSWRIING